MDVLLIDDTTYRVYPSIVKNGPNAYTYPFICKIST